MERLGAVAGKQTLRLTHYGRTSGKPYQVTIWFVVDGDRVILGTANIDRQWVRNVRKTPSIKLLIADQTFDGEARFLDDRSEHEQAQAKIRRKYWLYAPVYAVARILVAIGFAKGRTGSFEVTLKS